MDKIDIETPQALKIMIWWAVISSIFCGKFKTFRRAMIYILHKKGILDISDKPLSAYTERELCKLLDSMYKEKVKKTEFYELMKISKNTFNKYFADHIEESCLKDRRSYTLLESYELMNYWQGEGKWFRFEALKKHQIAAKLTNGDYKELAIEFKLSLDDESKYMTSDKISPRVLKQFLKHIDFEDTKIFELL